MDEFARWELISARHDAEGAFLALAGWPGYVTQRTGGVGEVRSSQKTRQIVIRGGDSLESIARQWSADEYSICILNDLTEWPFVDSSTTQAQAGIAVRGQVIRVPTAEGDTRPTLLMGVGAQAEAAFGADIRLEEPDSDGLYEIATSGGDIAVVTGEDALRQSLATRLRRLQGWAMDYPLDGVPEVAGETADTSYLRLVRMKVAAAIKKDPRVAAVQMLSIELSENVITITVSVTAADGKSVAVREDIPR